MATQLDSISKFASLVNQLQQAPQDPALKQAVVRFLPEMMALAKVNALALYHLAQVYHPSSPTYRHMMLKAADQGCTNAMLAACQLLLKTGSANDLKEAVRYMQKIEASTDSYIKNGSKALLETYPDFAAMIASQYAGSASYSKARFFSKEPESKGNENFGMDLIPVI